MYKGGGPQDVTNTAWALAVWRASNSPLLATMPWASIHCLDQYHPPDFSGTLWAYAKLAVAAPPLLQMLVTAARDRVQDFPPM